MIAPRLALLLLVACFARVGALAQTNITLLSTRSGPPQAGAAQHAWPAAVTPDGHLVLFSSAANNLLEDPSGTPVSSGIPERVNVFLHDRTNGLTRLVSAATEGWPGADADCLPVGISTNRRFVLFESAASNLTAQGSLGFDQIYLRDMEAGSNILISAATDGSPGSNNSWGSGSTPDGRFVVYVSAATNLVANDTNSIPDVFRYDANSRETVLVSSGAASASGLPASAATCERPVISPSGRHAAYLSSRLDLVEPPPGRTNVSLFDVYLRDMETDTNVWASRDAIALGLEHLGSTNVSCFNLRLSDDGQWLWYMAALSNSRTALLFRYHVPSRTTEVIHTNAIASPGALQHVSDLAITADGLTAAFVVSTPIPENTNATSVLVWKSAGGPAVNASVTITGLPANGLCKNPTLDNSGRRVAFISNAPELTTNTAGGRSFQLFLRDIEAGVTSWVNSTESGEPLDVGGAWPLISMDSKTVLFAGRAAGDSAYQVYARNVESGALELISKRADNLPALSGAFSSSIDAYAVVSDGKRIVYTSFADDLTPGDTNQSPDVFLYNLEKQTNMLISGNSNGVPANHMSLQPWMSTSGRFAAFTSAGSDFAPQDTNSATDVILKDLETGASWMVSTQFTTGLPGTKASYSPQLSADGTKMVFQTYSTGMAEGSRYTSPYPTAPDLIFCDLSTGKRTGLTKDGSKGLASMSANGEWVAFTGSSSSFSELAVYNTTTGISNNILTRLSGASLGTFSLDPAGNVCVYSTNSFSRTSGKLRAYNLSTRADEELADVYVKADVYLRQVARLAFSADGNRLAFSGCPTGIAPLTNRIYVYDFANKTNLFVSGRELGAPPLANDEYPDLSPDGRWLVFRSIVPAPALSDSNSTIVSALVLHDLATGSSLDLIAGPGLLFGPPRFSSDGHLLVFSGRPPLPGKGDFNGAADVYAVRLNLGGQIPVFSVALGKVPGGWLLKWPIQQGKSYAVQYKNALDEPAWTTVTDGVEMQGNEGRLLDTGAAQERYYRVVSQ